MSGIGTGMPSSVRLQVSELHNRQAIADRQKQDGRMENMENKLGQLMDMLKQE
jgi:hypothetical protein